jgi:hypothetical protein
LAPGNKEGFADMSTGPAGAIKVVADLHAPEFLVSDAIGVVVINGNMQITFSALRASYPGADSPGISGSISRVEAVRVSIPIDGAANMIEVMTRHLQQVKQTASAPVDIHRH